MTGFSFSEQFPNFVATKDLPILLLHFVPTSEQIHNYNQKKGYSIRSTKSNFGSCIVDNFFGQFVKTVSNCFHAHVCKVPGPNSKLIQISFVVINTQSIDDRFDSLNEEALANSVAIISLEHDAPLNIRRKLVDWGCKQYSNTIFYYVSPFLKIDSSLTITSQENVHFINFVV